jgi:hypothetical protein
MKGMAKKSENRSASGFGPVDDSSGQECLSY